MKLTVEDRVEQGSPGGVLKFRPGTEYACEEHEEAFLVNHEARIEMRRVQEGDTTVRRPFSVSQTRVPRHIVEKMIRLGVAKLEE